MLDTSNKALIEIECYDQVPGTLFNGLVDKLEFVKKKTKYTMYSALLTRCKHRRAYIIQYKHLPHTLYVFYPTHAGDLLKSHIEQMLWKDEPDETIDGRSEITEIIDDLTNTKQLRDLNHVDFVCNGYYISGEYGRKNQHGDTVAFMTVYSSKERPEWIINIQNYVPGKEINLITSSERDMVKILSTFSYTLNFT